MYKRILMTLSLFGATSVSLAADPDWLNDFRKADLNDSGGLSLVELGKSSSSRLKPIHDQFQRIDADADGQVTRTEYEAYLARQASRLSRAQFSKADLNDSGGLSQVELDKARDKAYDPLRQHFAGFDSDHDGQVTYVEYEARADTPAASSGAGPKDACQPDCGVVLAVDRYKIKGEGSALGAIAGGVAGGLLGNQVGKGTGNTIATVGGAAGGAYVGHKLEQKLKTRKMVKVTVKFDNGEQKDFDFEADKSPVAKGDRVRIEDGKPVKYTGQ